jgi:hypothetical protein
MADKLKDKISAAIRNAPEIKEGNYISINIKSSGVLGLGKKTIELTGRAKSDSDKAKIEKIARENAGDVEVVSMLRVGRTG